MSAIYDEHKDVLLSGRVQSKNQIQPDQSLSQEARCPAAPTVHSNLHTAVMPSGSCLRHEDCTGKDEKCFHSPNVQGELSLCFSNDDANAPPLPAEIKICCHFAPMKKKSTEGDYMPMTVAPYHREASKRLRCLGRKTLLLSSNPVACYTDEACPVDYECSQHTTTGDSICCQRETQLERICPENREPYR